MKWEWAPRDPELMGPIGNWETADGKRFFCQWVDACPPREEMLRGALRCHLDDHHDEYADFDDFYHADVQCGYVSVSLFSVCIS